MQCVTYESEAIAGMISMIIKCRPAADRLPAGMDAAGCSCWMLTGDQKSSFPPTSRRPRLIVITFKLNILFAALHQGPQLWSRKNLYNFELLKLH